MSETITLDGKDNAGRPRQDYAVRIAAMTEPSFSAEAKQKIWLSAYASNNRRSDYHWMADACFDEAQRRGKPELYTAAFERASST
jgi:hypothetical protein